MYALEGERFGDYGHGECAKFLSQRGHDRRGSGSGTAAQTGRYKDHVGLAEQFNEALCVFQSSLAADLRIGAGSATAGELAADLQLDLSSRDAQRLFIGIDGGELHALDAGLDHAVDGVATAAADADDFDPRAGPRIVLEVVKQAFAFFGLAASLVQAGLVFIRFWDEVFDHALRPPGF